MTILLGILILIWLVVGILFLLTYLGMASIWPFSLVVDAPQSTAKKKTEVKTKKVVIEEKEEEQDEDAMAKVQFFKAPIVENKAFYESLTSEEKAEFNDLFVNDNPKHLVKALQYTIGGNNQEFFAKVFNFIFRYRKSISLNLLVKLYQELLKLAGQQWATVTLIHEAMIRTTYARRKDQAFLDQAIAVSQADVALHQTKLNTTNTFVYSFKRLAIILEKRKNYTEALKIVDDAISRKLIDKTVGEYPARRTRLLEKKN